MNEKLTKKQEDFIQQIISGKSHREAYKAVYGCKKWKDSSIDKQANSLLKTPKVFERYTELLEKVREEAEKNTILSGERVMEEMAAIAFSDIKNYIEPELDRKGNVKRYRLKNWKDADTRAIQEVRYDKNGNPIIKMHSKTAALFRLLEIYHPEIVQHEDEGIQITFEDGEEYAQ